MTSIKLQTVFTITFAVAMLGVVSTVPAFAAPVENPTNGNHYELISAPGIQWTDAKIAAETLVFDGVNGHLVTITSADENAFVAGLSASDFRPWIGLTDQVVEGTYEWVTGEPFVYSNWSPGEPSAGSGEDYIEFFASNDKWNDNRNSNGFITGYVVEFEAPVTNEDIFDELKDMWMFLQNDIFTLLQSIETTVNGIYTTVNDIDTTVNNIDTTVNNIDTTTNDIDSTVSNIESEITNPNYGLEEIKLEIKAIEQSLGNPTSERVSITVNLDDKLKTGQVMVLLDTTGSGTLSTVHVAASLPCNITGDGKPTAGGGNDAPGVYVVVGEATGDLTNLIWDATTDTGFEGSDDTCVYHASVDAIDVTGLVITDVIIVHPDNHPDADKKDIKKHEKLKGLVTVTGTYN